MITLSTKGVDATEEVRKPFKYISYGIQKLKIKAIELKSSSKGSFITILHMETPEVTEPGFEGHEGALGRTGKVQFPRIYVNPNDEKQMSTLVKDICIIADKLGVRTQVDAIEWSEDMSIEKYFKLLENIFKDRYAMWKVCGKEEYWSDGSGKKSTRLSLARWKFIQSIESYETKPELTFDPTVRWDFEPAVAPDSSTNSDLPF